MVMRGSLDDLIRFLLEEIAICGEHGAQPADIPDYVAAYYEEHSKTRDARTTTVDRSFQEQVWKWLTKHPEIHVGRENQGNELSLSEVEAWNASETSRDESKVTSTAAGQASSGEYQDVHGAAPKASEDCDTRSSIPPPTTSAPRDNGSFTSPQPQLAPKPQDENSKKASLRVYTSQGRIWSAAAGHAPDYSRIPRLDFALLSIIAARRGKGILQTDLIHVSGQDKRSVPRRTDRLQESGYIEKKAVHVKGLRTSICTLKRFANGCAASKQKARADGYNDGRDMADRSLVLKENLMTSVVEVEVLLQSIIDIVRESQIITWDDLKRRLGVWGHPWESRLAANVVRRLEMMDCLKRVRATGNYIRPSRGYYRCVKFIRELQQHELRMCIESPGGAVGSLKTGNGDEIDAEGEDDEDYLPGGVHYETPGNEVQRLELHEVGRVAPRWIAGQNITNFLYDLVHNTGIKGISTMEIKSLGFGEFFKRPLEHQLSRLVDLWQLSQPPHLRHLAIIRDTALTKRTPHYVHYSFDSFKTLVDSGKASWEAVEIVIDNKNKNKSSTAASEPDPSMDEYGFSEVQASRLQGRNNDATLLECVLASGAEAYTTPFDRIARKLTDGSQGETSGFFLGNLLATAHFRQGVRWATGRGASVDSQLNGPPRPKEPPKPKPAVRKPATQKPATPKPAMSISATAEPATPESAIPQSVIPQSAIPQFAIPQSAIPQRATPEPAMPQIATSKPATLKIAMLKLASSKPAMLEPITSESAVSSLQTSTKVRGRPRKYPAEGTPIDLDRLTPAELKKLKTSQERAAYYVRKKQIAEEASRRVEAGKDPVAAREAVPAEVGQSKKEKEASSVGTNGTAAETIPSTQKPNRKRKRNTSLQIGELLEGNGNSVDPAVRAAHPPITSFEEITETSHGDSAIETGLQADLRDPLSTSISRQLDAATEAVMLENHGLQPTDITPRPLKKRRKSIETGDNAVNIDATPGTNPEDLKTAGYQALVRQITRSNSGIFMGPNATRKTGRGGRPPKARLAIIKLSQLTDLPFFKEASEPVLKAATFANGTFSTSHDPKPPPMPAATASPLFHSLAVQHPAVKPSVTRSNYVSPYGPKPSRVSARSTSEYISPYAPKTGEKRKRTTSSALETSFPGPRRGLFEMLPLASASNNERRSVVPPSVQRLDSQMTRSEYISDGQTALEHVTEQLESNQCQGITHNFVQPDIVPYRSTMEPMEDAKQTASASGEDPVFEPMSIDTANDRGSDSQSTVTDPDLVVGVKKPEHSAPVDRTSASADAAMIDNSIVPLGDPDPACRIPDEPQLDDLPIEQFSLNSDKSGSQRTATDPVAEENSRTAEESGSVGELHKSLEPTAMDVSSGVIGDSRAPDPSPDKKQLDERIALNADSANTGEAASDSSLVEDHENAGGDILIGEQNKRLESTIEDVSPGDLSTGQLSKEKQPDGLSAQQPDLDVQSQSSPTNLEDGTSARQQTPQDGIPPPGTTNHKQADADSQVVPDDGLPKIICVSDADENSTVKGSSKKKNPRAITRITPTSGSIGILRQRIIMDIVETCGGVFPGDKELWYPFTTAWLQRMPPGTGKPDSRTITTAKKALIASGKLRQLRFTFQNKRGVMVENGMITTTDVHSNAPVVRDLQRKMIEQDPWIYVPQEADVAEDLRKSHASAVVFGTNKTTAQLEVDEGTQVKLQYVPACVKRATINKETAAARKRAAAENGKAKDERKLAAEEKRNARLQKLLGVPDFAINSYWGAEVVMGSEKEGASEFKAFEGASSPSVRRPGHLIRRVGHPHGPENNGAKPKVQRLARLRRPSPSRPRQRIDYAAVNRGQSPHPAELQTEMWEPDNMRNIIELRFIEPLGLDSIFDRTPSPDLEGERPLTPQDLTKATFPLTTNMQLWPPQFDSSYQLRRVSTLMDPDHHFHPVTGTYSVHFSVFRNARLGLNVNSNGQAYKEPALPDKSADSSLESSQHHVPEQFGPLPGSKGRFESEIDDMLLTELNAPNLCPTVSNSLRFINHVMPHPHYVAERARNSDVTKPRLAKAQSSWPSGYRRLAPKPMPSANLITPAPNLLRPKDTKIRLDANGRPLKKVRVPGPERLSKFMSLAMEKRLMTAVIVIQTLTGGLEGNFDWNLVATLFHSTHDAVFIHNRWASLWIKYKVQIEKMQADFQNLFASAYEENLVPPLNFDDIESYDWAWLVDWTQKYLEHPLSQTLPGLPTNRAQLDGHFDLRPSKEADLTQYFSREPTYTILSRETMLHRKPMVAPLTAKSRDPQDVDLQRLEVAKSWVRANVVTFATVYNPALAHQKLTSLPESAIFTALRSLLSDRVVAQVEKGRLVPGRNYILSEFFFNRLEGYLAVPQLQRATQYKLELDKSFAEHGKAEISYHAEDGDMLALTNLVAHKRVKLVPRNPPMEKFGLMDRGYKTRFMDKARLHFAIDIFPTDTYIPGLPTLPTPPVPQTTDPDDPHAKLPLWIDIHGNFVQEMWHLVLAAVLSLVALRPGIGAQEVARRLAPCLGVWEVESVFAWLVRAGLAGWTEGAGVLVGEGWWGVLGIREKGGGGGKGKGNETEKGKEKEKEKEREEEKEGGEGFSGVSVDCGIL